MEFEGVEISWGARLLLEQRDALVDKAHLQLDARNIEEARRLLGRARRLHARLEAMLQDAETFA